MKFNLASVLDSYRYDHKIEFWSSRYFSACNYTADKDVTLTTDTHVKIEELLEAVFSKRSVPSLYNNRKSGA
jgi:hypothetical protein